LSQRVNLQGAKFLRVPLNLLESWQNIWNLFVYGCLFTLQNQNTLSRNAFNWKSEEYRCAKHTVNAAWSLEVVTYLPTYRSIKYCYILLNSEKKQWKFCCLFL
jgi:hypothetical protein